MYVNFSDEIKLVFRLRCGLMRVIKGRAGVFLPAMFRQPILRPINYNKVEHKQYKFRL